MLAPMPPAEPLLGHARVLARDPLRTLVRWMNELGPVVRFRVGRREAHVAFGPEAVRRVLSDPDGIYGKDTHGYRTLRLFVGDGLLTSEGSTWVRQRRILQPAFHRQAVDRHVRMMGDVARSWVERLVASKEPVGFDSIAMQATLEIVARAFFDADLAASAGAIAEAIGTLQVAANRRISAALPLPFAIPTPEHWRIRMSRRRLRGLLEGLVEQRRKRPREGEPDVVDLLLAARDEAGEPLPRALVLDELVTLLIAGHESTANTLSWALVLLSTHPAELRLLRAELDAAPDDPVAIAALPRLRAVVDEVLRLYPPAWSFGRAPRRDDEIGRYSMPAGHLVMVVPWATHRDRTLFRDPEAFHPSRFLEHAPPPFAFLPFGGGPRTCIGHAFARLEAQVLLGTWLRELDLELVAGQDLEPAPLITLRPRAGVRVHASKRAS